MPRIKNTKKKNNANKNGAVKNAEQPQAEKIIDYSQATNKAKEIRGYYSNDDVIILLDGLLKRSGFERIRGGDEQDILRNIQTGDSIRTMVLAPIAEDSEEAVIQLSMDISRAYKYNIEQVLVPMNIPNIHWYTIQLRLLPVPDGYSLEATIHDSLGIRKNSIIVEKLAAQGLVVSKQAESNLSKIQRGELGAKNVYCGGYTARLIANLALDHQIAGEAAWGCPNNGDNLLRQEDVGIVNAHNAYSAGNFGKESIAVMEIMDAAHNMNLLRNFIAGEKKAKLLQNLKEAVMPEETKIRINSLSIPGPEDSAGLFALARELYVYMPDVLKVLFQINAEGEIEKDSDNRLKLDTNIEVEHVRELMIALKTTCSKPEIVGALEQKDKEVEQARVNENRPHNEDGHDTRDGGGNGPLVKKQEAPAPLSKEVAVDYLVSNGIKKSETGLIIERVGTIQQHLTLALHYLKEHRGKKAADLISAEKTIFETIIGWLAAGHQDEWNLLQHLAWLDSEFTSEELFLGIGNDQSKLWKAIVTLERLTFVRFVYREDIGGIVIAGEVQEQIAKYATGNPAVSKEVSQVLVGLLGLLDKFLPIITDKSNEKLEMIKAYMPIVESVLQHSANRGALIPECKELASLNAKLGRFYWKISRNTAKSLDYKEKSLALYKALYKEPHLDVARALKDLGNSYVDLGNANKGLTYLEQALEVLEALSQGDHHYVITSLNTKAFTFNDMGLAYHQLGDMRKCLYYYEQGLAIMQIIYHVNRHHNVAIAMNNVGSAYQELGDVKKGLRYQERALTIVQDLYQDNHPEIATFTDNVGGAYHELGDIEKSFDYREQALKMRQALYQDNHLDIAKSLNNVGNAYLELGNTEKGLDYQKRALKMVQSLYQGNHPHIATFLNNLGFAYKISGDIKQGLYYYERSLAMRRVLYQGDHPHVAASLSNVGIAYQELGEVKKGLRYQEQALTILQSLYPGNHPQIVDLLYNVGNAYLKLDDGKKALDYKGRALKMKQALNSDHKSEAVIEAPIKVAPYFGNKETSKTKFVGREEQLKEIQDKLTSGKVVIIKGMPGVGKTSTALHYARSAEGYTPIWFDSDSQTSLARSYGDFGKSLELGQALDGYAEDVVMRLINNKISNSEQEILFIFDNLEGDYANHYVQNLPKNVKLLVTTRHDKQLVNLGQEIRLDPFSLEEASKYLYENGIKEKDIALLVKAMGIIPQHLSLAVGYLQDNRAKTVEDIVKDLKGKTIFEIILGQLRKECALEWEFLQYMSWLNPDFIPESILLGLANGHSVRLWKAIGKLETLSLVRVIEKDTKGVEIHREAQDETAKYVSKYFNRSKNTKKLLAQLLKLLNKLLPLVTDDLYKNWAEAELYLSSLESIFEQINSRKVNLANNKDLAALNAKLGEIYQEMFSDYRKALVYKEQALNIMQALYLSDNHIDIATLLNRVGAAYEKLGDTRKEVDYKERSLKMMQALDPSDNSPEVVKLLEDLGLKYQALGEVSKDLGKLSKGIDYKGRALIMKQALGSSDIDIAYDLNKVGAAYEELGEGRKGLDYKERAITIRQALEGNQPDIAESLDGIGLAYQKFGDDRNALAYYEQALAMRQAIYPGNHKDIAASLKNVGLIYKSLGDTGKYNLYEKQAATSESFINKRGRTTQDIIKVKQKIQDALNIIQDLSAKGIWDQLNKQKSLSTAAIRTLEGVILGAVIGGGGATAVLDGDTLVGGAVGGVVGTAVGVVVGGAMSIPVRLEEGEKITAAQIVALLREILVVAEYVVAVAAVAAAVSTTVRGAQIGVSMAEHTILLSDDHWYESEEVYRSQVIEIRVMGLLGGSVGFALGAKFAAVVLARLSAIAVFAVAAVAGFAAAVLARTVGAVGTIVAAVGLITWLEIGVIEVQRLASKIVGVAALDYVDKGYLKNQLGEFNNAGNIEIALSLCFEAIAIGIANSDVQNLKCAISFAKLYPNIVSALAIEHPEYFITEAIAKACLSEEDYQKVISPAQQNQGGGGEFKGQGTLSGRDSSFLEYYNSGLDRVFELRLNFIGSNSNAVVLRSRYFDDGLDSAEKLVRDVTITFSGSGARIVFAPFNLYNKHWLGLLFRSLGSIVEVTHMDSEQRAILPGLRAELENGLRVNGYESRLQEARLVPQSYNNCGYEVIENFVYYFTGARATQEGAVYVHSLLVENSLLDPKEYGLKIEENNRIIGFLSNSDSIDIRSMDSSLMPSSDLIRGSLKASGDLRVDPRVKHEDATNVINSMLHRTSIGFKALDFVVDSARLVREPTVVALKKIALDYAQLYGMVYGVNCYSVTISVAEALYQLHLGEYREALGVASGTVGAMALPVILAMANMPYLGVAYGTYVAVSTAYGAITNAYSFALELGNSDANLRSAMIYKDLAEWLAESPLQSLYNFGAKAKEYKLWANDLLFEKEKASVEAEVKEKGEFEQKVFDYVYLPTLLEKYGLMNDVVRGVLTEDEAESLKAKHVAITSTQQSYEHCMEIKSEEGSKPGSEYYCYNMASQVLDHVAFDEVVGLTVIEHL